jgi:3',5'-cyclic AMP phosphodiesterase CpdA
MTLLVQITDTHIQPRGELLYGQVDTSVHLREIVSEINRFKPTPDLLVVTGDLVEKACEESYAHFRELIAPIRIPVYVLPGNHDDPAMMAEIFSDSLHFPVDDETYQYAIRTDDFRLLALNSHAGGSELPELDGAHLDWLIRELPKSTAPTILALHHPPFKTGIEFIDMGGTDWFQGLKQVLQGHHNVHLAICGHCHTDMAGRIANVPVYMSGSVAHQLIAARDMDIAPSFASRPVPPVLHHFIDGQFVSGSYPWPLQTDAHRIDKQSGIPWERLKLQMMGSKAP